MARGVIAGALTGLGLSAIVLGAASLLGGDGSSRVPLSNTPPAAVDTPNAGLNAPAGIPAEPVPPAPEGGAVGTPAAAPEVRAPAPEPAPATDTAAAPRPDVADRVDRVPPAEADATAPTTPAPDAAPGTPAPLAQVSPPEAAEGLPATETGAAPRPDFAEPVAPGAPGAPDGQPDVPEPAGGTDSVPAPAAPSQGAADQGPTIAGRGPSVPAAPEAPQVTVAETTPPIRPAPSVSPAPSSTTVGVVALAPGVAPADLPLVPRRPEVPEVGAQAPAEGPEPSIGELPPMPGQLDIAPVRPDFEPVAAADATDRPPEVFDTPPPAPGIVPPPPGAAGAEAETPAQIAAAEPEDATVPAVQPLPTVRQLPGTGGGTLPGFQREVPNVRVNRLPSIAGGGDGVAPESGGAAPPSALSNEAVARYAARFEPSGDKPLVGVVLLASEGAIPTPELLADLPFPVSVALDPTAPDAEAAAAGLRAAGFEVVMIAKMGDLTRPVDVELAYETYSKVLPETVAVIEASENGLPQDRSTTRQLVNILDQTGHGLLTYPRGLNTAQQLAEREDVPAALIDGEITGADPLALARELDRAAFRAGRVGTAVVVGPATEATMTTLLSWALSPRGQTIDLAPVSAVLRKR